MILAYFLKYFNAKMDKTDSKIFLQLQLLRVVNDNPN